MKLLELGKHYFQEVKFLGSSTKGICSNVLICLVLPFFSVMSVSDTGFWEGAVNEKEGWFPPHHVQEVRLRNKGNKGRLSVNRFDKICNSYLPCIPTEKQIVSMVNIESL